MPTIRASSCNTLHVVPSNENMNIICACCLKECAIAALLLEFWVLNLDGSDIWTLRIQIFWFNFIFQRSKSSLGLVEHGKTKIWGPSNRIFFQFWNCASLNSIFEAFALRGEFSFVFRRFRVATMTYVPKLDSKRGQDPKCVLSDGLSELLEHF